MLYAKRKHASELGGQKRSRRSQMMALRTQSGRQLFRLQAVECRQDEFSESGKHFLTLQDKAGSSTFTGSPSAAM